MALVTIQVIDGLERGRVFSDLTTPVTIGREDENIIRLNDERVSRFHAKIQEDGGRVILTDLDSTNGTRVNGYLVQMRVLRVGDQLSIGRCTLLYGSPDEILSQREKAKRYGTAHAPDKQTIPLVPFTEDAERPETDEQITIDGRVIDLQPELFKNGPPEIPRELSPLERAQLADVFAYFHEQLGRVSNAALEDPDPRGLGRMFVDWADWQRLLRLEMDIAGYLREINEPSR